MTLHSIFFPLECQPHSLFTGSAKQKWKKKRKKKVQSIFLPANWEFIAGWFAHNGREEESSFGFWVLAANWNLVYS